MQSAAISLFTSIVKPFSEHNGPYFICAHAAVSFNLWRISLGGDGAWPALAAARKPSRIPEDP